MSDHNNDALTIGHWYKVVEDFKSDGTIELMVHDKRTGDVYSIEVPDLESYDKLLELLSDGSITKLKQVVGQ